MGKFVYAQKIRDPIQKLLNGCGGKAEIADLLSCVLKTIDVTEREEGIEIVLCCNCEHCVDISNDVMCKRNAREYDGLILGMVPIDPFGYCNYAKRRDML